MKILTISLNLALVITAAIFLAAEWPLYDMQEFLLLALFFITPLVSLYYILISNKEEGWLSLMLKRKALEEKKKIENLKKG